MSNQNQSQGVQQKPNYQLIAILISGAFVALLANTFLNVALPAIQDDFGVTTATVQWVATGYMLVAGVVIPVTAYLMTKFHTKTLFLVAMMFFFIGTLIAGTSPVFGVLLMGRMIQSVGSSILMPLLMNVIISNFPVERRGYALGLFSFVMFFAPAIGPTLSGLIVQFYSWRMLFLFIAPIILFVIMFGYFKIPKTTMKREARLDITSLILSTIGFGSLLYGLSSAGNHGLMSPQVLIGISVGLVTVIIYVHKQWNMERPMLNFRVFEFPMFSLSILIISTINLGVFSGFILMPMYLIDVQDRTPLEAGLLLMPGALIMGFMSPISGKLYDRFGARNLAIVGLSVAGITNYFFSTVDVDTSFTVLVTAFAIRALGMTLVLTPLMTNGMNQLTPQLTPHGSSINSMSQQVSGAIGTAGLIAVMQLRMNMHIENGMAPKEAMLSGINLTFFITAMLFLLAVIFSMFIRKVKGTDTIDTGMKKVRVVEEEKQPVTDS